jgi:hypothetical protein
MRTTLNLDDELLMSAKRKALEERRPLSRVIEDALRESLARPKSRKGRIQLVTSSGPGVKPGVDLDDGRSLLEIMDDSA